VGGAAELKNLYVGAAGVIWALDAVRRRGHAETSLDLAAAALCAASACAYLSSPSSCRSFVDPSTSVKRSVTVPV
jgi:hypothetical protein